jgi:hypothetical protein
MAYVPERTCLACGRKATKSALLRITRNSDGMITIDPDQRLPGRGAYVCRTIVCAELLKRKQGLHRGFRRPVPVEIYENILNLLRQHATS